ncbi:leucine carboxyl methyltransferase 1-like [Macrosteles quadrilineatus]|uniref:leucine carboxyl methyltransferase 1-like n=1 Tax=Macrosteles quadrilineatus TaxID=74068 RepID=UPI0023E12558|nr:leucine carboxyl methyltransferase 1-like [Macrosteles quadrilineatus]
MEVDEAVQATNDDASECKRCAVQLGYWEDKYIHHLVRGRERKAPEINRGYFARVKGVGMLLNKVLKKTGQKCQIINLGAGFDTLYWRLKDMGYTVVNFTEIDFPSVTSKKCFYIKRNKTLLDEIYVEDGEVRLSATDLHAGNYHVVGADLRNLAEVQHKLAQAEISFDIPTIFIAECVLVYIETALVSQLLSWIVSAFPTAFFINYEQVNMGDKFGQVMMNNLRARGCPLAGVEACHSLDSQMQRFVGTGWDGARAWDMVQVYNTIPASDRQRIEQLEFLDEQELLTQLFQHYCVVVGWHGPLLADVDIS